MLNALAAAFANRCVSRLVPDGRYLMAFVSAALGAFPELRQLFQSALAIGSSGLNKEEFAVLCQSLLHIDLNYRELERIFELAVISVPWWEGQNQNWLQEVNSRRGRLACSQLSGRASSHDGRSLCADHQQPLFLAGCPAGGAAAFLGGRAAVLAFNL